MVIFCGGENSRLRVFSVLTLRLDNLQQLKGCVNLQSLHEVFKFTKIYFYHLKPNIGVHVWAAGIINDQVAVETVLKALRRFCGGRDGYLKLQGRWKRCNTDLAVWAAKSLQTGTQERVPLRLRRTQRNTRQSANPEMSSGQSNFS